VLRIIGLRLEVIHLLLVTAPAGSDRPPARQGTDPDVSRAGALVRLSRSPGSGRRRQVTGDPSYPGAA
jgi:hypothetical protein